VKNKLLLVIVTAIALLSFPKVIFGQAPTLGATSTFALFTSSGAFDSEGATHVTGNIGSSTVTPTISSPGTVDGTIYNATTTPSAVTTAVTDLYTDLFGRTPDHVVLAIALSGTLTHGVWTTGSGAAATLDVNLTLDGEGDPDAIFIIKIDGALTVGASKNVILINSASPNNVYWQITGAFSLGASSVFRGTIVSGGAIVLLEGSSLIGRGLTKAGAIHLHNNIVTLGTTPAAPTVTLTQPTCAVATGTITVTAPTGTGMSYSIDGLTYTNTTGIFPSLTPGIYNKVTAKDANGYVSPRTSITINAQPSAPSAATASTTIQPTCALATGTIVVTAPIGAYEYNIDAGTYQASVTFAGIAAGSHNILVRSTTDNTCISGATAVTVNAQPSPPSTPTTASITQPTCALPTGTIVFTTQANVQYSVGSEYQAGATFSSLAAGTYTLTVRSTSDNTCITAAASTVTITAAAAPAAATASTTIQPTCALATGTIVVTAPVGAYEYNIDAGTYQSSVTFAGIAAGSHNILVRRTTDNTCISGATVVTVNAQPAIPSVTNQTESILTGESFTITPTGVPVGTTYEWTSPVYTGGVTGGSAQSAQTNITGTLTIPSGTGTATYTVTPISGSCVGATFTVTVTVSASCISVSIGTQPVNKSMCATSGNESFTIVASGTSPFTYQWQYNNSGTWGNVADGTPSAALYTNATTATLGVTGINTAGSPQYRCYITNCSGASNATSNAATLTVNANLPASVSIAAVPSGAICAGTSVTFTATPTNGGAAPAYQWKVNGTNAGTNSATFTTSSLANNDAVTCVMTSNATPCLTGSPATSNTVTMTVNPNLPASVSIAAGANPVCSGTSVTFTATPANGGTTPTYQWKKGGTDIDGATSVTYAYAPVNGDVITVVMTSNATCATGSPATSNTVTMTVNSNLPASVTIAADANPVCTGTSVTFTATPTNGGIPTYQWKKGGVDISGATNSTYTSTTLANNDVITVVMTSTLSCATGSPATSNTVTMTVTTDLPVSVSMAASVNPVCAGTSVTFTATPTNSGATPAYQWYKNSVAAGTNSATYAYVPVTGDQVYAVLTSSLACASGSPATSNTVTMTVTTDLPVSVSIAASVNPVCAGTSVTFTATPTNGGATPVYQWKVNGTNAGTNNPVYSFAPVNGDVVTCVLTSNAICTSGNPATSNAITMTVHPLPIAFAGADATICETSSYTLSGSSATNAISMLWSTSGTGSFDNAAALHPVYTPSAADILHGSVLLTFTVTPSSSCPAISDPMVLIINRQAIVNAGSDASVWAGSAFTVSTATAQFASSILWTHNGAGTLTGANTLTPTYTPGAGETGVITLTVTASSANPCIDVSDRMTITITVDPSLRSGIVITKQAMETSFSAVGDAIHYNIDVVNMREKSVYNVSVSDHNAVITSGSPIGILDPGKKATVTALHTITQVDLDAGKVLNAAYLNSSDPEGDPVMDTSNTVSLSGIQRPQITATKFAAETTFRRVGEIIHYTIEVFNCGNVTVKNIVVSDPKAVVSEGSPIISLAPRQTVTVTAEHVVTQVDLDAGKIVNIARVTGQDFYGNPISDDSNEVTLYANQAATLVVTKFAEETSFSAIGDTLHYVIAVRNFRNTTMSDIMVSDPNAMITGINPIFRLESGNTANVTAVHVITQKDLDAGKFVNVATARGSDFYDFIDRATSNEVTVFAKQSPNLILTKTVAESSYSIIGDLIHYANEIKNTGNVKITGITLTDPNTSIIGSNQVAGLNAGESVTIRTTYTITQADLNVGKVEKTASVSGNDPNNNPIQTSSNNVIVKGSQQAQLVPALTAAEITYSLPGDLIHYSLQVRNTGNVTLTNIGVDLNAFFTKGNTIISLVPGAAAMVIAEHLITQADLLAGKLISSATVTGYDPNGKQITNISNELTIQANQAEGLTVIEVIQEANFGTVREVSIMQLP